ncbi:ABC transporter permease subunit [Cryobacterium melibiosiphilum]|uniref:ABC transporter permease subunit n=1 Tax=Cryobacterium melibiosiphilum TaxID=995039 RepID=A0A3A5MK41_9MICO|nr:ABC transporter permease subunit [Cryobacterium melibiosiphilum]RJT89762.1 ABC transporter permease subunit [Cryobacterium melibiosiphilum]
MDEFYRIPIGTWGRDIFDWFKETFQWLIDIFTVVVKSAVEGLVDLLLVTPTPIVILLLALIGWYLRSWQLAVGTVISLLVVDSMGFWESTMQTLGLVIIATLIAIAIAVPLGILAAKNDTVSAVVKPVLDFMQTMPAFVYLIPAVLLFSIGFVPGIFATVIFSLPPGVRFTELGIRGVDSETVEAGHAFGVTPGKILRGIQLPLATPTIMAGINQVIMLALSMAVLAGFVGADGLGKDVVAAVATQRLELGIEAGLCVVIIAVFLDRLTAALGNRADYPTSIRATLSRRKSNKAIAAARSRIITVPTHQSAPLNILEKVAK